MRRKGEDTFAIKRRRMPYVAKIKRNDPFRSADRREINAMLDKGTAEPQAHLLGIGPERQRRREGGGRHVRDGRR